MKFLVTNYSCLQNPWLGGYRPQIPVLSVLNWICWTPPPKKIPGYATGLNQAIYLFYSVDMRQCGRNDQNSGGKMALHHNTPVHVALDFQNFLPRTNLQWFHSNRMTLMSLQQPSMVPETKILINRTLISICRGNTRKDARADFYIHGSVHCESNLISVQQDATYSVYYISVGSSTCFGCWYPSSGARTTVITASGID